MLFNMALRLSVFFIVLSFFKTSIILAVDDVNCKTDSCDQIICPASDCTYGKLMVSPNVRCSCCKTCLNYIGENEVCGVSLSDRECGPGLTCTPIANTNDYRCLRMTTACFTAQAQYDEKRKSGSLGMYESRPSCDANGDFSARSCQPGGSCYCVDKGNNRIFGDSPSTNATSDQEMNCACSRAYQTALEQNLLEVFQFPHCLPNGNYDSLQCISQACYCIDSSNQTRISDIVPITAIDDLPCFDPATHYTNYFRPCEVEKHKAQSLIFRYSTQNTTILPTEKVECSPDGYYKAVMSTAATRYCADPSGRIIENFEVPNDSEGADVMDCRNSNRQLCINTYRTDKIEYVVCARTRYWLNNQNTIKPRCCKNGNYRPYQCRGGVCFCVDTSGNQVGGEVAATNASALSCYVAAEC